MTVRGRQTAVAVLRATWDTLVDDRDYDYDRADQWLDDLGLDDLRAAVRLLAAAVIAAADGVRPEDRARFLCHVGLAAAAERTPL